MHKLYIAAFAVLVLLQQAIHPVQVPLAATAQAASVQTVSTEKSNYNLNLNINKNSASAIELKDTRVTFDEGVLKPLRTAQEAKAKADADAAAQAAAEATSVTVLVAAAPKAAPRVIGGSDAWAQLRFCEAGGDYSKNTGNGYYGAYQYNLGTWANYGGYARPDLAPPEVQDAKAQATQAARGWGPWPACARKLGLL